MNRTPWLVILLVTVLGLGALASACGSPSRASGAIAELGFNPSEVEAVVVGWSPLLERVPPPRRTTDQTKFAPLLQVLNKVNERANPPDLLGPPIQITLESKGGKVHRLELWGPYIADKDRDVLYAIPTDLQSSLRSVLESLSPPPIEAPARLSGTITVSDLVRALQEHGVKDARETGEEIRFLLFGARSGQVIHMLGQKVQVYSLESPEATAKIAAMDPQTMTIDWIARPSFVAVGNLLITVVIPEQEMANKIVAYLEMVRK